MFNLGDGQDVINDYGYAGYQDVLRFGAGISAANLGLNRIGQNLVVTTGNNGDQISIQNWFDSAMQFIERFEFADGTVLNSIKVIEQSIYLGTFGNDVMSGFNAYNEQFSGNAGDDTINGNAGNDRLDGGDGNDTLNGGLGNDIVIGGEGKDNITGGSGNDRFVFNSIADSVVGISRDVITDFVRGTDKLDLSVIDANALVEGNQSFILIANTCPFTAPGQIKFVNGVLSGEITGTEGADFEIELTGVTTLAATDLVL